MSDFNTQIIEDFRANQGNVGGIFEGKPVLLLHHKGAKTGTERVSPLMYQKVDGGYAIFASKGGAPDNPDWFHNIKANPETEIEVGADRVTVKARIVDGDERETIWERQKSEFPQFAEYEANTDRTIPVIVLEPSS